MATLAPGKPFGVNVTLLPMLSNTLDMDGMINAIIEEVRGS